MLKRPLTQATLIQLTKAGFVVKIFLPGLQLQASLSPPGADIFYSSNELSFYVLFVFDDSN